MNINQVRIANVLFALLIVLFGKYNLLWYIIFMQLSLEILNSRPKYFQHPYRVLNFIFWSYDLVLLERLRGWHFSETIEYLMNCVEHLAFGVIICLKIYIYAAVFTNLSKAQRWKKAMIAVVVFNIIGVINEVFQNAIGGRTLFVFIADSIKDLWMNLLGGSLFLLTVLCRIWWLSKKPKQ
jgi:hypothetical protein